jgi:hypothetical protein
MKRDAFVNKVFSDAKLPLLTIRCAYSYNLDQLRDLIIQKLDVSKIEAQN